MVLQVIKTASTWAKLHQIDGVTLECGNVCRWRDSYPSSLSFHEVDLNRFVASIDQVNPRQKHASKIIGPKGDPGRAIDQSQSFPDQ